MEETLRVSNVFPGPLPQRWGIDNEGLFLDSLPDSNPHTRAQAQWDRSRKLRGLSGQGLIRVRSPFFFGRVETRELEMHRVFFSPDTTP